MRVKVIQTLESFRDHFDEFKALARLRTSPDIYYVGFDIEFIQEQYFPKSYNSILGQRKHLTGVGICTIQLAARDLVLILLIDKMMMLPSQVETIITSASWIKAGVGVDLDLTYCMKNFGLTGIPAFVDLKTYALLRGVKSPSLENLVSELLGETYTKRCSSICDWTTPMTEELVGYAAEDAFYSYVLGAEQVYLQGVNPRPGRMELEFCNKPENDIGKLQELCQRRKLPLPVYRVDDGVISCEVSKDDHSIFHYAEMECVNKKLSKVELSQAVLIKVLKG